MQNKLQTKIISSKLGSPLGSGFRSGLGLGSARVRDYSALFGLGSAQGSARGRLSSELHFSLLSLTQPG